MRYVHPININCGLLCVQCLCVCCSPYCHVGSTASTAGLGLGVDEASADAEVAQFNLTFRVQEDVGGFDVPVNDTMFLF